MKVSDCHIGFIGFGHMAQIIFRVLEKAKLLTRSQVSFFQRDTHKMRANEQAFGITSTSLETLLEKSDLIFLCVRPNQAKIVLEQMREIDPSKMIISVLAGIKLDFYRGFIQNPILRLMPNVASEVGMGMSVLTYSPNCSLDFRSLSHILLSSLGEMLEVPESLMDISCAIAGSGPGFVFRLIDAMAKEGEKQGLSSGDALKMAAQTFMGASRLVLKKGEVEPLLIQIATPNGTTEAGLHTMNQLHIHDHLQQVIQASCKRSKELSEET